MNREDPLGPLPQDAALEKFRFLAFFGCDVLPSPLFNRVCKPSLRWDNSGELEHEPFILPSSIISQLPTIIEEGKLRSIIKAEGAPWSEHYIISQEWKERLLLNAPPATCRSMQFAILDMIIWAFPTPWTEISWEEVENQLWDVVRSTCVPFLGVLDIGDVMEYMDEVRNFSRERKYLYLAELSKFLLRLSTLLGDTSPPSIPSLITDCLQVLQTWPGVEYLYLSKSIVEGQLQNLSHHGSMGLNGTIGLALASLMPPGRARSQSKLQSDAVNWAPLCKLGYTAPSTMEILAQVHLFGATSLKDIPGVTWNRLSLETKALIAFCEMKHKSFENAIGILVQTLPEIEEAYDAKSMEFVLVGTTLINCFNATRREDEGEALARSMCAKAFGWLNSETLADSKTVSDSPQHTYFMISMADSFLGQGKYDSAELLCEKVLKYRFVASDMAISAALRLLKMSRRRGTEPSSSTRDAFVRFDAWKLLREISGRFHEVSGSLKYAFLEETMCFLSVLDPKDTAQTSHASEVVNTLSQYSISDYKGTTASEKNFQENLEALHHYRPTSHESIEPDDVLAPEERKFSKARRGPKTGPLSPPPDASDGQTRASTRKRGLDGNDSPSAGGGNGGDGEPNKRRKIKEPSDRSNHKYACPFFKRDPEKYKNYRSCPGPGWETVRSLKQHIYTRHVRPIQCERCWDSFKTSEEYKEHQRAPQVCQIRSRVIADGYDRDQERLLRSKKKLAVVKSESDKWKQVWKTLFPEDGDNDIPTPFYNTPPRSDQKIIQSPGLDGFAGFEEYRRRELPRIIKQRVEESIQREHEPLEERVKNEIAQIIRDCTTEILQDYRRERQSVVSTPAHAVAGEHFFVSPPPIPAHRSGLSLLEASQNITEEHLTRSAQLSDSGYRSIGSSFTAANEATSRGNRVPESRYQGNPGPRLNISTNEFPPTTSSSISPAIEETGPGFTSFTDFTTDFTAFNNLADSENLFDSNSIPGWNSRTTDSLMFLDDTQNLDFSYMDTTDDFNLPPAE